MGGDKGELIPLKDLGQLFRSTDSDDQLDSDSKATSWLSAAFIMVNSSTGASILALPVAYEYAGGIYYALGLQIFLLLVTTVSQMALAYCAEHSPATNYQKMCLYYSGPVASHAVAVVLILASFGAMITLVVVVADQFEIVFEFIFGRHAEETTWYLGREFTSIVASLLVMLPISFYKDVDSFTWSSVLGVVTLVYPMFLIVYKCLTTSTESVHIRTSPETWAAPQRAVPIILFTIISHEQIVHVYKSLKDRSTMTFFKTTLLQMVLCCMIYYVVGAFGFLTFGDQVTSDVLMAYRPPDWLVVIANMAMIIKYAMAYPLSILVVRLTVDDYWLLLPDHWVPSELGRRVVETLILFVSSIALAFLVPDIVQAVSSIAWLSAAVMSIFPGICLVQMREKGGQHHKLWTQILGVFLIASGVFFTVSLFIQSLFGFFYSLKPGTVL